MTSLPAEGQSEERDEKHEAVIHELWAVNENTNDRGIAEAVRQAAILLRDDLNDLSELTSLRKQLMRAEIRASQEEIKAGHDALATELAIQQQAVTSLRKQLNECQAFGREVTDALDGVEPPGGVFLNQSPERITSLRKQVEDVENLLDETERCRHHDITATMCEPECHIKDCHVLSTGDIRHALASLQPEEEQGS